MNNVLLIFLSLSFSGSIVALALLLIKPLIKNRLSQTWQYYIWLVVILRFLLPFTPQVSLVGEVAQQIQSIGIISVTGKVDPGIVIDEDNEMPQDSNNAEIEAPVNNASGITTPHIYWRDLLSNIWLVWIGVALMLFVHKVTSYRSFVRFVNSGKKPVTDTHILDIYADEHLSAKIKRSLRLYMNNQVVSPMLVGILRPALILPVLETSDDELRQIFRHEITHYKRLDFLYKWIVQITLCLHWFNPLVYLISRQINKSCELSCDEAVIKQLDEDGRITYGDALMASLSAQGNYSDFVVSITMSENVNLVKERLDKIMSYKTNSKIVFCVSVLLTALLFCGAAVTGAYAFPNNTDSQEVAISNTTPIKLSNNDYTYLAEVSKGQLKSERIMFETDSSKAYLYLEIEDYSEPIGIKVFYGDTNKLVLSALEATFTEGGVPGFLIDRGKGLYSVELIRSKESTSHSVTVYGVSIENFTDYDNLTIPAK